jgi:hypothetical protein
MPENAPPKMRVGLGTQRQVFLKARRSKHRRRLGVKPSGDSKLNEQPTPSWQETEAVILQVQIESHHSGDINPPPSQFCHQFSAINISLFIFSLKIINLPNKNS